MRGRTIGAAAAGIAVAATLATAGAAQLANVRSVSIADDGQGGSTPVLFACDVIGAGDVLVMSTPDRDRVATLTRYATPGLAVRQRTTVRIGAADPGMGQLYYPLTDRDGRVLGNVHAVNPAMVEPGATTPTVTSITLGADTHDCRFAAQTRVLGVAARRAIQITGTARDGFRYRSYDHDAALPEQPEPWGGRGTRASLTIDGGRAIAARDGQRIYQFANDGYLYRIFAAVDPTRGGGGVQVWRDGRLILSERFGVYTAAL